MKTQIFAYKGYVGIKSDLNAEGLVNDPSSSDQIGFVVDASYCEMQQEAVDILKKLKKSSSSFGDIDVFKTGNGKTIISWLGGPMRIIDPNICEGSRNYDPDLLTSSDNVVTPNDFIEYIDSADEEE